VTSRKSLREKPTAAFSYHLGLNVVRGFIENMARHTVEEIQGFTGQWIPAPHWVKTEQVQIPSSLSDEAASLLIKQLGPLGTKEAGGEKWWQWRKKDRNLSAEWIEMRKDHQARGNNKSKRILFFVHGGAYYFGSVDEHRYQIQRHARKLKARAFAPRYRLAPQFPFPCGLHDILAAYLYLLTEYPPTSIICAGDSAGGGMVCALLVTLRDQGIPLPAGAMLFSPWVDLTHSFPSICGDGKMDYIPTRGFIHKPSVAWPPPSVNTIKSPENVSDDTPSASPVDSNIPFDDLKPKANPSGHGTVPTAISKEMTGESQQNIPPLKPAQSRRPSWIPSHVPEHHAAPVIEMDGEEITIKDQIQIYAPNFQLVCPLVSPALNPSLGGLCPLLIQVGGGELLSDEQIYFAHKAANPTLYPPPDEILDRWDPYREIVKKYPPTNVQLQVWDDLCHVPHTLAWTTPAKYMYRSAAQFGAWALARAQKTEIDIDDDGDLSDQDEEVCDDSGTALGEPFILVPRDVPSANQPPTNGGLSTAPTIQLPAVEAARKPLAIGKAGHALPAFEDHMIRQRVDVNGNIFPFESLSTQNSLQIDSNQIGVVKEGPVHKWLMRQRKWEKKHARLQAKVHKEREVLESHGMPAGMEEETPPPTALVRRWTGERARAGKPTSKAKRQGTVGLRWWTGLGGKYDEEKVSRYALSRLWVLTG